MITNKLKLFLLLTFGFIFSFAQNSFAEYVDTTKHCASFSNGNFVQYNGLQQNEYCIFSTSDLPAWDKYAAIGLKINEIKIPYSAAAGTAGLWEVIRNTTTAQNEWGVSDCNSGSTENLSSIIKLVDSTIVPYLTIPKTYDNVKTAMIRSCLPGHINVSNRTDFGNAQCVHYYCNNRLGFKTCHHNARGMTFNPVNYPSWEFAGCGLNDENSISLTTTAPLNSSNNRYEVGAEGSFTLNWSLANPSASCTLSGKNATNPSETFERKVAVSEVGINVRTGQITPKSDSFKFNYAKEGIYTYTLSCAGILDGKKSAEIGVIKKEIKIYVGNIPPDPIITFNLVQPNPNLISAPADASYDYSVLLNQTFQLEWNVTNLDKIKNTGTLPITIKRLEKSSGVTSTMTSSANTNFKTSPIKLPSLGTHEIYLEATNPDFPDLRSISPSIKIRVKLATTTNTVSVDFSADKTNIKIGEPVELNWDASDAAKVTIDQGIGSVAKFGKFTVYPTDTTTYTLTAKSPIINVPDTTKIITINVTGAEITPIKIEDFEISTSTATTLPEQEGKPTADKIDIKVNGVDGPITLSAPAKFALSWNLNNYCLATGAWLDVKTKAGSQSMTLNKNGKYTYSLYCPGYGTDSVVVNVVNSNTSGLLNAVLGNGTETTNMPIAEASFSTDFVNYSQDIKVVRGEPVNIYIKIDSDINNDGMASRDAYGGWSELMTNGGYCLYNNDLIKGTPQFNGMIKYPATAQSCNTTLGTFTFNDEPGTYQYGVFRLLQNDQKLSNISYVNIIVEDIPAPSTAPVIDLKINGNNAVEQVLGTPANFNVTWNVTNANTCEASGSWSGSKELNGVQSFVSSSKKDFIYTLTCVGQLGTSTKVINLKVAEAPVCSFTALPPTINKSSSFITDSELSWKCDYADSCDLLPSSNTVIKTYGSLRVSPEQTTTYVLTCNNSEVSKSFEAKVEVNQ